MTSPVPLVTCVVSKRNSLGRGSSSDGTEYKRTVAPGMGSPSSFTTLTVAMVSLSFLHPANTKLKLSAKHEANKINVECLFIVSVTARAENCADFHKENANSAALRIYVILFAYDLVHCCFAGKSANNRGVCVLFC